MAKQYQNQGLSLPDLINEGNLGLDVYKRQASKALECMMLDGEKRYFRNAGPNLFRVDSTCYDIKIAKEDVYKRQVAWKAAGSRLFGFCWNNSLNAAGFSLFSIL